MKILVSASACNPYQGSEPGVGWTAVCRIARDHDVFVLTDANNRRDWEKARNEGLVPKNVQARFIRKSSKYVENRFLARLQSWQWYAAYTRLVLKAAQEWHKEEQFDLCHQVTIAAWRLPSPLWKLPIAFVWGPIGGAGNIPRAFRSMLSPSARLFERARDMQTWFVLRSRSLRLCLANTAVILAANKETSDLLLPYRGDKPMKWLPVSSISRDKITQLQRPIELRNPIGTLRLFAGGNIEGRKGVSLALKALAAVAERGIDFHYTVAGGGPEISALKQLAAQLGIDRQVTFHPGYSGAAYIDALHHSDVYLLPSFRETMGITLVEAVLAGNYPIVADTSAQGEIVRAVGGKAVAVDSMDGLIKGLEEAIVWCSENSHTLYGLANEAGGKLADLFSSERYDATLQDSYKIALSRNEHSNSNK